MELVVSSGEIIFDPVLDSFDSMTVLNGGIANDATVYYGGVMFVSSGGTANNTVISSGGSLGIASGGVADGVIINSYGQLHVSGGGTAMDVRTDSYGFVYVSSGGLLLNAYCSGGYWDDGPVFVLDGGIISSATVVDGACLAVSGFAYCVTISGLNPSYVGSGEDNSDLYLYNGGYAENVRVEYDGNYRVFEGATAKGIIISSGGTMWVKPGGKITGRMRFEGGAEIDVQVYGEGAIIDFDISGIAPGAAARLDNLSRVSGWSTADFTLTLSDVQEYGNYTLANGAAEFDKTITVQDTAGTKLETLSIGQTVYVGENSYSLNVTSGSLNMNITSMGLFLRNSSASIHAEERYENVVVDSYGKLTVSSGGATIKTTVNSGGSMHVSSGGTADHTTVNGGSFFLSNGGVALQTTVNSGGSLKIFNNGMASNTTVNSGGSLFVSSGGSADDTTVNSGGWLKVQSNGMAGNTTVNSGGSLYVSNGGSTDDTTVNSGGCLKVFSNGSASQTTVNSGGSLFVSNGGSADDTTVNSGGWLSVLSGGMASQITVNSGGSLSVSTDGKAVFVKENGGFVSGNATFVSNSFSGLYLSGAAATIHSGTTAADTMLHAGGFLYVYSGGITNSTTVCDGGSLIIESGGLASGIMVDSNASLIISSGGMANNITMNSGSLTVFSGGKLTGRLIDLNKSVYHLQNGAIIDFDLTQIQPGTASMIRDFSLIIGTPSYTITIRADQSEGVYKLAEKVNRFSQTITVMNNAGEELGVLSVGETVMISNTAYTLVLSDKVLSLKIGEDDTPSPYSSDGLIINSGTRKEIKSGEVFHDTLVVSGTLQVFSGGVADSTTIVSSGSMFVSSGGTANSTTVCPDGALLVSPGGTAMEIEEKGGFVSVGNGANVTFAPHAFFGYNLNASATIHSGTTANSTTVLSSGNLHVLSGGTANKTTVNAGGSMVVSSGGTANGTMVNAGGSMLVSSAEVDNTAVNDGVVFLCSGAVANQTKVFYYGSFYVSSGGIANNTEIDSQSRLEVFSGGVANQTMINSWGSLYVSSGGTAVDTTNRIGQMFVSRGGYASSIKLYGQEDRQEGDIYLEKGGHIVDVMVEEYGDYYVSSGGTANKTTVNFGGALFVSSGGTATGIREDGGYVEVLDGAKVTFTSNTFSGMVLSSNYSATVHSGTTATNTTVNAGGRLEVFSGGIITGQMTFDEEAIVSAYAGAILNFDISGLSPEAGARVNNLSIIHGTPRYRLTVSDKQAEGIYTLAEDTTKLKGTITIQNSQGKNLCTLPVGETVEAGYNKYTLDLTNDVLSVTVEARDMTPTAPVGTADRVSWEPTGANNYIVEYSMDHFEHIIQVTTATCATDILELPAGTYQWRVKADANSDWVPGNEIFSDAESGSTPKVVRSNADGKDDLLFATANGTWDSRYCARHVGSVNDWNGVNDIVPAAGKSRIQNLFFGSADPNVLCLTDADNGDAIFVDDIFTDLPEEVEKNTARLYRIQEIRAGAGNDIVDMTSRKFEYTGDGLTVRGGEGDDTIWANKGDNTLFGDRGDDRIVGASGNDVIAGGTGNDSMHGGGGDDVFTFCDNWGVDTIEQTESGSVTLWFASGDRANWNESTRTYSDGGNSVTVSFVPADQITLKFGDDGSTRFAALSGMGAFAEFTSNRIFEESAKGDLATL